MSQKEEEYRLFLAITPMSYLTSEQMVHKRNYGKYPDGTMSSGTHGFHPRHNDYGAIEYPNEPEIVN